jgi:hypothetical protein
MMLGTKLKSEGILYKNSFFYMLVTFLKLRGNKNLRFQIAARHILPGQSVLDVASGGGWLRDYIPATCSYACIEVGDAFIQSLAKRQVNFVKMDLHQGMGELAGRYDVCVMLISLYQFRHTSADLLMRQFKEVANKVVIVEEVADSEVGGLTVKDKILNYLCRTEYFVPTKILSEHQFRELCKKHGYDVSVDERKKNYMIATHAGGQ